jgi:CRP/FNR family transcriptional regulator, cyclic AMP receptor protein
MMLVERVAALHEVDLFSAVPGRMLASVAATAEEVTVEPGSTFIEHGAVEDCLYVVVSGRVRVHHDGQVLAELGAGSSVGELAVLVPGPRSASVTAVDSTLLLRLRKAVLDELLADRPELATEVIRALVLRLRERADAGADDSAGLE